MKYMNISNATAISNSTTIQYNSQETMKSTEFNSNDEKRSQEWLPQIETSSSLPSSSSSSASPPFKRKRLDQSSPSTTMLITAAHRQKENKLGCRSRSIKSVRVKVSTVCPVAPYSTCTAATASTSNTNLIKMTAAAVLLVLSFTCTNSYFTSAFIIQPHPLSPVTSSSALQMVSTTERVIRKSRIRATKVATTRTRTRTSTASESASSTSSSNTGNSKTSATSSNRRRRTSTTVSSTVTAGSRTAAATGAKTRNTTTKATVSTTARSSLSSKSSNNSSNSSNSKRKVVSSLAETAESLYNLPSSYDFDGLGIHFEGEEGMILTERGRSAGGTRIGDKFGTTKGESEEHYERVSLPTNMPATSLDLATSENYVKVGTVEDELEKSKISMKSTSITGATHTRTPTARIRTITNISKRKPSTTPNSTSTSITPPRMIANTSHDYNNLYNNNSNKRSREQNTATTSTTIAKRSRSSTMPGFKNREHTKRRTSFRDGMKIVQDANIINSHTITYTSASRRGRARSRSNHKNSIKTKIENAVNSEVERRSRGKTNSEAMYSSSASVPDSLIAFTNEIHMEERITPKEEIELGTLTQEAIRLQKLYDNLIAENGREPSDDEWCAAAGKINMEALQNAIEEGIQAKNQLVTSNLRMVQGVVNLYIRNGLGSQYNAGDLMQEGTVALIRAAEKFEPQRGFRFSTYAMYWIRAAVKRSQILQSRVINVPQRLHETHKKVTRVESQLKKELGRKPTSSELAVASGLTESQLERCLTAISQQCFSLDAEIANTLKPNSGDKSTETSYNLISAKYDDVEYRELQSHLMKDDLVSTLKRYLSPHEVDLLLLRYGLMDEKTLPYGFSGPLTIAEVSRLVGLKPDKVRRMINKSLRQLRHLIAHEWEDFESVLQRY